MKLIKHLSLLTLIISAVCSFTACTAIMDDEPQGCPHGLEVRFIFDYNLERANAFPAQVECLVLHIYDYEGKLVNTLSETTDVLATEDYRMIIDDLPEGDYRLIAYGGSICDQASIKHNSLPLPGSHFSTLGMRLDPDCLKPGNPKGRLHDHFYGSIDATIKVQPQRNKVTVKMMKNTNHFRIILEHLNYEPLDGNDYDFEIVDDNTLFDHNNDLVDNGLVTYTPWDKGNIKTGIAEAMRPGSSSRAAIVEVQDAYADLSTSRLMLKRNPILKVTHRASGQEIINIPLNNYLLALQSNHYDWCSPQEFLDRGSYWPMYFFMDNDRHWNQAYVKVLDWEVRINNISAGK